MAVDGLLSLRWNNHLSSFLKQLSFLRDKETYSDLTLVCGGQFYQVHRLVVSGCSEYFRAILEHTPCRHPAVVLQDLPPQHLEALLSYMYLGQVSVPQDQLGGLIKAAECLAIKGLAVPDEATTPPPPQQQECHGNSAPAWEDEAPRPKRRRQGDREVGSPSSSAHADDLTPEDYKGRGSRRDSREKSPTLSASTATSYHKHTLVEETAVIKVEDEENEEEVKCEESTLGLGDPCEGLMRQDEASHGEEGQAIYLPGSTNNNSGVLQQYPSQPQSIEEVATQALPGPSGIHREAGQGWESGQGKGNLTTAAAAAAASFPLENFPLQQDARSPTHHAPLHQREPSVALRMHGTSHQEHSTALPTATTLPMLPLPCTAPEEREAEAGGRVGREWRCRYPDCGYVTDRESWLKQHYRKHTGEKPFACPLCSFRSAQKGNVNVHIRRVHYGGSIPVPDPTAAAAANVTATAAAVTSTGPAPKPDMLWYFKGKAETTVPKVTEWGV